MDRAEPGHTVEFTGLQGAAHLNGTRGTLVRYLKKERRWAVRCELDGAVVHAKPANLALQSNGPTVGSVLSAAAGADCLEEHYLRTLLALGLQAEAADDGTDGLPAQDPQELVADAVGELVDRGAMDGEGGERFVAHLHRRTREEQRAGNAHGADIMGFIDTVLLTKLVDRIAKQGTRDKPVSLPKFLQGSMAGALSFEKSYDSGVGSDRANAIAAEVTRRVDDSV